MHKITLILTVLFLAACSKKDTPSASTVNTGGSTTLFVSSQHVSVSTQHNDHFRTGWNDNESELTTANVNPQSFGLLFSVPVDDQVYAQPLVAGQVSISNGVHNLVIVATVNNSIYAFDGDKGIIYWNKNYTPPGMRVIKNTDMTGACGGQYHDFSGNMGIVGTPVIDTLGKAVYFVARSVAGTVFHQFLHKVSITDGSDMTSPVEITATYQGNGSGSVNGIIGFDPQKQNQRAALTLFGGMVYITWSSHCDWGPYHGWVMGYDAGSLQQRMVFNTTPDDANGGIWESGQGPSVDAQGNLYLVTGNGGNGGNPLDGKDFGESAIKLAPNGNSLTVSSFFTPYNYMNLNDQDLDMGSIGSLLIPNSNYFLTGCKDGSLFLLNTDSLGGYDTAANHIHQQITLNNYNANEHCQAAYFNNGTAGTLYVWSENDPLRAYPFAGGFLGTPQLSNVPGPVGQNGAMLAISARAGTNGIIWASYALPPGDAEHGVYPGILRALDASNISNELWNSSKTSTDNLGNYAKFSTPTVANGHVYMATFSNKIQVYGLKTK